MKIKLEKNEIKYAALGTAIILLWTLVIRNMIVPYMQMLPPVIAMIIYNIGLFAGILILSHTLGGGKFKVKISLIAFIIFLGIDIITVPYLVGHNGMIRTDVDFWFVSADAAVASFWGYIVPQAQIYMMTYIVTPILLVFILPILISDPKKIKKALTGA